MYAREWFGAEEVARLAVHVGSTREANARQAVCARLTRRIELARIEISAGCGKWSFYNTTRYSK